MLLKPLQSLLMLAALGLITAACSPSSPPPASQQKQAADDAKTQSDLALYRGLLAQHNYPLAAPIGAGVVARAPGSAAAAEINKTLADAQARAKVINEKQRLENLWIYQSGEESGGQQNTATLYPGKPVSDQHRIRLILRRHSDWGQSAYLYDGANLGFVCKGQCKLALEIDGKPAKPLKASLPDTRDPAMFIDNDKRFLGLLDQAHTLDISANIKGQGMQKLQFEVAGFNADKWPEPAHGKADKRSSK